MVAISVLRQHPQVIERALSGLLIHREKLTDDDLRR
jgi:hypothetical protein